MAVAGKPLIVSFGLGALAPDSGSGSGFLLRKHQAHDSDTGGEVWVSLMQRCLCPLEQYRRKRIMVADNVYIYWEVSAQMEVFLYPISIFFFASLRFASSVQRSVFDIAQ